MTQNIKQTSIPFFPKELKDLEDAYNKHLTVKNPNTGADFYAELLSSVIKLNRGEYQGVQPGLCIAYCGVTQYSWLVDAHHIPASFFNEFNDLLTVLAEYELVATLSTHYGQENAIAALVLTRVYMAQQRNVYYDMDATLFLLTQLTGKEPPPKAMHSLQKTVAVLYGDAAWDLYGLSEVSPEKVPHLVYIQQIPIINKYARAPNLVSVHIPPDIT